MAQNPDAVKNAIAKAIERGDVVSRSQVMKEIRSAKTLPDVYTSLSPFNIILSKAVI